MRAKRAAVVAVSLMLLAACGTTRSNATDATGPTQATGVDPHLQVEAMGLERVESLADVLPELPFVPQVPAGSAPQEIGVTPAGTPDEHVEVDMEFAVPELGTVLVAQMPVNGTAAKEYEELAAHSPGCVAVTPNPEAEPGDPDGPRLTCYTGNRALAVLGDGTTALLGQNDPLSLTWVRPLGKSGERLDDFVDPLLEITIYANAASSPEQVVEFASSFVAVPDVGPPSASS